MFKFLKQLPRIIGLGSLVLPLSLIANPAFAFMDQLGIVRSTYNQKQWAEITSRLNLMNIDYCILNAEELQSAADLDNVRVLLLPNVENITYAQARSLETWMLQGGKVIVTGPTGNLANAEVREQLQSLFGASWNYALPVATKLQPQAEQAWISYDGLTANLRGGVLQLNQELPSETAAVWSADGTPPAVVFNDGAIFLGWRWGVDAVSSMATDIAWLTAALNYHGQYISTTTSRVDPQPCNPTTERDVIFPDVLQKQNSKTESKSVQIEQMQGMNQELEGLIARYQTTLNMIEAHNSSLDLSTTQIVIDNLNNDQPTQLAIAHQEEIYSSKSHQVLAEAKKKHQQFLELIRQQEYQKARQQWYQTRNLLLNNYPIDRLLAQPEVRAMWVDRGTIVKAKSPQNLARIFDRLAASGINTVFFETLNASYPIYPSRVAPEQNPLIQGWDPLATAVNLAHERGMELHAWVWVFAAANQAHNRISDRPIDYLGPVLSLHPDWLIRNRQGDPFDYNTQQKKAFYDPANPEVQQYLLSVLNEISNNYQVDGIHLDYIRYPFQNPDIKQSSGYGKKSRQQFQALTGVDPLSIDSKHPLWSDWNDFKINQINNFVFTASQQLKQDRPDLIISTAVFPLPKEQRLKTIQQHWEYWAENEWVDLIVLMSYGLNNEELALTISQILENNQSNSTLIIPGITINNSELVTIDRMQLLRNTSPDGYALFATENFTPSLERILRQTQGNIEQPLPYRQPFETLSQRYQGLQREWSFLISQNKIVMDTKTMQEWSKQVDSLAASLDRLAEDPSRKNLLTAQIQLSAFRRRFDYWMWEHQSDNIYQVKAWQYRLASLEKLLNYGSRAM